MTPPNQTRNHADDHRICGLNHRIMDHALTMSSGQGEHISCGLTMGFKKLGLHASIALRARRINIKLETYSPERIHLKCTVQAALRKYASLDLGFSLAHTWSRLPLNQLHIHQTLTIIQHVSNLRPYYDFMLDFVRESQRKHRPPIPSCVVIAQQHVSVQVLSMHTEQEGESE